MIIYLFIYLGEKERSEIYCMRKCYERLAKAYCLIGCLLQLPVSFLLLSIHLCFPLVPSLVDHLNPVIYISFTLFYPHDFRSIRLFLEYSLQNIPLYY